MVGCYWECLSPLICGSIEILCPFFIKLAINIVLFEKLVMLSSFLHVY